jgi:HAD superfamily phosphoserine phosphatase-like hydrolase
MLLFFLTETFLLPVPIVYLVAANSIRDKPLDTDLELRSIINRIQGRWQHAYGPAPRLNDLIDGLRDSDPDIVHFSGHGSSTERLVILNDDAAPKEISRATLEELFKNFKDKIRVVVLSACYSETQAKLIAKHIDCVIGVSGTLDDSDAAKYSQQFYGALVAGRSVQKAHDEAKIVLTDVPAKHKPTLQIRTGCDADSIFVGNVAPRKGRNSSVKSAPTASASKTTPTTANSGTDRKKAFQQAVKRFGISADAFSIVKIIDPDGSSVTRYEIVNLRCQRGEISTLCWRSRSSSGLVTAPDLESGATNLGIDWVTEPDSAPETFEDLLKNLGTMRGEFTFDPPIKVGKSRSFAWTVKILNGDALNAWEFESLYALDKRTHVSKKPLGRKPVEFCAQLVWFPVQKLSIGLRLPPSQKSQPELKYFALKDSRPQSLPSDQVFRDGKVRSYPEEGSAWERDNAKWERNIDAASTEGIVVATAGPPETVVEYPTVGSYYSMDWTLPDHPLASGIDRLRSETEEIRNRLLVHKEKQQVPPEGTVANRLSGLFLEVHEIARKITKAKDPSFTTALMIWNRQERRMVTVSVCRNKDKVTHKDLEFWLPFGLGIAGACFRTGPDFVRYARDLDHGDPERPENYLPLPKSQHHAYLLSIAIDHPEWTDELRDRPNAQRCRQLVGVLSLGSTLSASQLGRYCGATPDTEEMRALRDACQTKMNAISNLLLEEAGVIDPSQDPKTSLGQMRAGLLDISGITHEPDLSWKAPVPASHLPYKVVAFDFDGTLLRGQGFNFSWETVWERLGFDKEIQSQLKRKYRKQAGKNASPADRIKAYKEWCEGAVAHFKTRGLTRDKLREMSKSTVLTANCREALAELRSAGIVTVLISGGLDTFLQDVFPEYKQYFDFVFINELLFEPDGKVAGVNASAFDFEGKADALQYVNGRTGTAVADTVFVGDHFNDEYAMLHVSKAIAYPPSDDVTKGLCHVEISEDNLLKVLPHILSPIS